jgi:hypothetical protein
MSSFGILNSSNKRSEDTFSRYDARRTVYLRCTKYFVLKSTRRILLNASSLIWVPRPDISHSKSDRRCGSLSCPSTSRSERCPLTCRLHSLRIWTSTSRPNPVLPWY